MISDSLQDELDKFFGEPILSPNSRINLWAPFLPIPGTEVKDPTSELAIALLSFCSPITEIRLSAMRGPTPETVCKSRNISFSLVSAKP